jgi:hypothetical protein
MNIDNSDKYYKKLWGFYQCEGLHKCRLFWYQVIGKGYPTKG